MHPTGRTLAALLEKERRGADQLVRGPRGLQASVQPGGPAVWEGQGLPAPRAPPPGTSDHIDKISALISLWGPRGPAA